MAQGPTLGRSVVRKPACQVRGSWWPHDLSVRARMRAALPGLLASLDALRAIDVSSTEGYGIWALDGTGPVANWAQALLAISQETAGARLAGRSGRLPGSAPPR